MEIRVLRYFLAVAREENMTKASEILHLTQPTLSRQIAGLEEEMGVQLFIRGSRKLTLTEDGMLLRRRAEEIIELVEKTERELAEPDEETEGCVTIGCGDLQAVQVLADIIRSFQEKYPRVVFDLYTAAADSVKERMDRGLTDIGVMLEPVEMEKYRFIRLEGSEHWTVLLHPEDPLAEKAYVTPEDLASVPLILPCRMNVQNELAGWFGDYYKNLSVRFTSNLPANSAVMVKNRLGCALVISGAAGMWDKEQIICKPLSPELTASSALVWRRMAPFGRAAGKFIEYVKNYFKTDKEEKTQEKPWADFSSATGSP